MLVSWVEYGLLDRQEGSAQIGSGRSLVLGWVVKIGASVCAFTCMIGEQPSAAQNARSLNYFYFLFEEFSVNSEVCMGKFTILKQS